MLPALRPRRSCLVGPAPPLWSRHPAAKAAQSLLSAVMPGMMEPQRPLATVRLPAKGWPAICAVVQEAVDQADGSSLVGSTASQTRLVVATGDGLLYSFRLELPPPGCEHGAAAALRHSLEGEWFLGPAT